MRTKARLSIVALAIGLPLLVASLWPELVDGFFASSDAMLLTAVGVLLVLCWIIAGALSEIRPQQVPFSTVALSLAAILGAVGTAWLLQDSGVAHISNGGIHFSCRVFCHGRTGNVLVCLLIGVILIQLLGGVILSLLRKRVSWLALSLVGLIELVAFCFVVLAAMAPHWVR